MSDLRTLRIQTGILIGHQDPVTDLLVLSKDGLIVSLDALTMRVWKRPYPNEDSYCNIHTYADFDGGHPTKLCYDVERRHVYVGTRQGFVVILAISQAGDSVTRVFKFACSSHEITCMQWLPLSGLLLLATRSPFITLYNPGVKRLYTRQVSHSTINHVFLDEVTETLFVADKRPQVKVFKLPIKAPGKAVEAAEDGAVQSLGSRPEEHNARGCAYNPTPFAALGSDENGVIVQQAHRGPILCFFADMENGLVLQGGKDRGVTLWNIQKVTTTGRSYLIYYSREHAKGITSISWDPRRVVFFSTDESGCVLCWDANKQIVINSWIAHYGKCLGSHLDASGGLLYTYGDDGLVKIWRVWIPESEYVAG